MEERNTKKDHIIMICVLVAIIAIVFWTVHLNNKFKRSNSSSQHLAEQTVGSCRTNGQILEGTNCSPALGVTNGRYVCREHGTAIKEVCEAYGTKVSGGVVYSEGMTIPPSVGTIRCNKKRDDVSVTVMFWRGADLGIIGPPLSEKSDLPKIEFGTDLYGWGAGLHTGRQNLSLSVTAFLPNTNFTPRLVVDDEAIRYLDLTQWTIAGDCSRIGCMMCRDGEKCPKPDSAECVASSIQAH
jgi:hypothetical protein